MSSTVSETDSTVIYLGDDKPVVFGEKVMYFVQYTKHTSAIEQIFSKQN